MCLDQTHLRFLDLCCDSNVCEDSFKELGIQEQSQVSHHVLIYRTGGLIWRCLSLE